jgi:hypothetical protein
MGGFSNPALLMNMYGLGLGLSAQAASPVSNSIARERGMFFLLLRLTSGLTGFFFHALLKSQQA